MLISQRQRAKLLLLPVRNSLWSDGSCLSRMVSPTLVALQLTHISFPSIGDDFAGRPLAPGVDVKTNDSALAQRTHSKTAQKILRAQKQPPAPTLFIGNLGFETTDDAIRQLFEAHRVVSKNKEVKEEEREEKTKDVWIRKVRMGTFEDSGLCKGYSRTPQTHDLYT